MRRAALLMGLLLTAPAWAVEEGDNAPDFTLPRLAGGGDVSLADFRGRVVYLDFWASWCPPCLISMPLLNEMRTRYREAGADFEVVAINVDTQAQDGLDFLADNPVDYVVLGDAAGEVPARYEIRGMPSSFLIDAEGRVRMAHQGFKPSDIDMIESELRALLEQGP